MPKRSSKDLNQTAASIVAMHTGQASPISTPKPEKNPAAVALGRLGGDEGRQGPRRKTFCGQAQANSQNSRKKPLVTSEMTMTAEISNKTQKNKSISRPIESMVL